LFCRCKQHVFVLIGCANFQSANAAISMNDSDGSWELDNGAAGPISPEYPCRFTSRFTSSDRRNARARCLGPSRDMAARLKTAKVVRREHRAGQA
jgi:hypothetical protein